MAIPTGSQGGKAHLLSRHAPLSSGWDAGLFPAVRLARWEILWSASCVSLTDTVHRRGACPRYVGDSLGAPQSCLHVEPLSYRICSEARKLLGRCQGG